MTNNKIRPQRMDVLSFEYVMETFTNDHFDELDTFAWLDVLHDEFILTDKQNKFRDALFFTMTHFFQL